MNLFSEFPAHLRAEPGKPITPTWRAHEDWVDGVPRRTSSGTRKWQLPFGTFDLVDAPRGLNHWWKVWQSNLGRVRITPGWVNGELARLDNRPLDGYHPKTAEFLGHPTLDLTKVQPTEGEDRTWICVEVTLQVEEETKEGEEPELAFRVPDEEGEFHWPINIVHLDHNPEVTRPAPEEIDLARRRAVIAQIQWTRADKGRRQVARIHQFLTFNQRFRTPDRFEPAA